MMPESTWAIWLRDHLKTCPICKDSFEGSGEQGMCEVAFAKFQEYLPRASRRSMIALLAIVKNERPAYMREWREHHSRLGVTHTYLLEHEPNDISIPDMPDTNIWPVAQSRTQPRHYYDALQKINASWCLVLDCDEFLVCNDLTGLLARQDESTSALAVYWIMFGSDGHDCPVYPVHGNYRRHLPRSHPDSRLFKSIVRPERIHTVGPNPHLFACRTVDELGREVTRVGEHTPSYRHIRINHYYTRSAADWQNK